MGKTFPDLLRGFYRPDPFYALRLIPHRRTKEYSAAAEPYFRQERAELLRIGRETDRSTGR
ncbi:hypothetical protein D3C87_1780070 [compost metagenome]